MYLIYRALCHVLQRVEILIRSRDVDTATPTACAIEIFAARIRNRSAVDVKLIVVETLVLWC